MLKYYVAAALMTVAAVLAVAVRDPAVESPQPPLVDADRLTVFATGFIQGTAESTNLRARLAGRVNAIFVRPGQFVEEGEVLLELESSRQRELVNKAAARHSLAQAKLQRLINGAHHQERREAESLLHSRQIRFQQAVRKRDRLLSLSSQQAISQQDLDDQEALVSAISAEVEAARARWNLLQAPTREDDLAIARAELAAAAADYELARITVGHTQLIAPTSGRILDVTLRAGEMTGPTSSQPAVIMADVSRVFARAYVDEVDALSVAVGDPAEVTADGMPEALTGQIVSISPQMERKRFTADSPTERLDTQVREVLIELNDASGLAVGLRLEARISVRSNR